MNNKYKILFWHQSGAVDAIARDLVLNNAFHRFEVDFQVPRAESVEEL